MKFKVYPKGYSPMIASMKTPGPDLIRMGITWTIEEHHRHKAMEKDAIIVDSDSAPVGRWYEIIPVFQASSTVIIDLTNAES